MSAYCNPKSLNSGEVDPRGCLLHLLTMDMPLCSFKNEKMPSQYRRMMHFLVPELIPVSESLAASNADPSSTAKAVHRSPEEIASNNFDKQIYFDELMVLAQECQYTPKIHPLRMNNIDSTLHSLVGNSSDEAATEDVVFNLCDGCDVDGLPGPSVAFLLQTLSRTSPSYPILVGCGYQFIQNTLSKSQMKQIFTAALVSTPQGFGTLKITNVQLRAKVDQLNMTYPLFVKVSDSYGSCGLDDESVCHTFKQLVAKTDKLWETYTELTIEEFIEGDEFTALIAGDSRVGPHSDKPEQGDGLVVYPPAHRVFNAKLDTFQKFVSFARNWDPDQLANYPIKYVPVDLPDRLAIQDLARRAYKSVGGDAYGRVDVRKRNSNGLFYCLEVNASCGIGCGSSSELIMEMAGHRTSDFFQIILKNGLESARSQKNQKAVHPAELSGLPKSISNKVIKLLSSPQLSMVPTPEVHIIVSPAMVDVDAGLLSPQGELKDSFGPDTRLISQLEGLARGLDYDPIVHVCNSMTANSDSVEIEGIEAIDVTSALVFNACLGTRGYHVSLELEKRGCKNLVGLSSAFQATLQSRTNLRKVFLENHVPSIAAITLDTTNGTASILAEMVKSKITLPVYVKPDGVKRQQEGAHSGVKLETSEALTIFLSKIEKMSSDVEKWVLEEFYSGTTYRVLVAGYGVGNAGQILVFPAIEDKSQKYLATADSLKPQGRRDSFMAIPGMHSRTISKPHLVVHHDDMYAAMETDTLMLQMEISDLARRAYTALGGSFYALVTLINGKDGLRVVGKHCLFRSYWRRPVWDGFKSRQSARKSQCDS